MVPQSLLKDFGIQIRELRLTKGWSQETLAAESGFHRTYIGMIERGERNISLTNIAVFAKVFSIELSELFDLKKVNPKHSFKSYSFKENLVDKSK